MPELGLEDSAYRVDTDETIAGGEALRRTIGGRVITTVCAFNYFIPYTEWIELFDGLLKESGG